nr:hypothetical protein [Tanacetum cinerariifolium]
MDMTINQQVALDEAIVPHASRLRIGKSNVRLKSEISSKESTLQLAGEIRRLTDVNINNFHQPWRSFAAIINKCLSGKSTGYDSLRLSQAQILWGLYHKMNVDFTYLQWEYFVYQVEHKDAKMRNKMYYPRFTKVIVHYFMSKDPSIPRRNMVNWHYVRDDQLFTTIKLKLYTYKEYYAIVTGATPPKTKANVRKTKSSSYTTVTPPPTAAAGIRLSTFAKGKQPTKASKAKSLTSLSEVAMTEAEQLKLATKSSLQQTHISQASGLGADEGTGSIPGFSMYLLKSLMKKFLRNQDDENKDEDDDDDQVESNNDDQDSNEEGEEFIHPRLSVHDEKETNDEESFDPITKTLENTNDEGNGEENLGLNIDMDEGQDEEDEKDENYGDVNINLEGRVVQMADVHTTQEFKDSHVTLTPVNPDDQQQSSSVSSQFVTSMLNPTPNAGIKFIFKTTTHMDVHVPTTVAPLPLYAPTLTLSTIATISTMPQAPTPPTTAWSTLMQDLPKFGSLFRFDHQLKKLESNFSEFVQTNQ